MDRASQRITSASLVAGEMRNFGRGTMRAFAAPVDRMRQVERFRGALASLGMDRGEVERVVAPGRKLMSRVAGITTSIFTGAAYDIRSEISSLDASGVADFTELAALTAAATKVDLGQMTDLLATDYGAFKGSLFEDATDQELGGAFAAQLAKPSLQRRCEAVTPVFRIVIDGRRDVTEVVRDRFLSLSVTDESGSQSDSAELRLDDRGGAVELPPSASR